jgi:hypothetical protein
MFPCISAYKIPDTWTRFFVLFCIRRAVGSCTDLYCPFQICSVKRLKKTHFHLWYCLLKEFVFLIVCCIFLARHYSRDVKT